MPKNIKFMNSGENLPFEKTFLPEFFGKEILYVYDIDVEKYIDEPIVIEIEW